MVSFAHRLTGLSNATVIACAVVWCLESVGIARAAPAWQQGHGFRFAELAVPVAGKPGFTRLAAEQTGIVFTNVLAAERGFTNQLLYSGSGVAAGDVDGDGWCDLYFCGLDNANALYRNLGGWKFQDVTAEAGVACAGQSSMGAALADVDGDGDLDLLVNAFGGGTRLFLNDGQGHFTEATAGSGLIGRTASLSLALADVDGDGDLDLYVTNYRLSLLQDEPATEISVTRSNGQPVITSVNGRAPSAADLARFTINPATMALIENGEPDALYLNDGRGHFRALSWTNGAFLDEEGRASPVPLDWGLTVMFRDLNGDGAPDIYVCNDMDSVDRLWLNDGAGRFRAIPRLALRHTCLASMGIDFADINRDGFDDFFVVDMLAPEHEVRHTQLAARAPLGPPGFIQNRPQYMRNTLYLNRGDGTYAEIAQLSGLEATDWSWLPVFLDVDLDGYEDVLVSTGVESSQRDADARHAMDRAQAGKRLAPREFFALRKLMPRLDNPKYAFRNRGDLTFEDVSRAWGFDSRQVAQGMALADLDNDGDLDVVLNSMNGPALVYRNESAAPRVAVRLKGRGGNTRGIGARIKVLGGPVPQSQEMIAGGRYLSGDDALRVFAAGQGAAPTIEVTWRSGRRSVVTGVKPNAVYEVAEADATVAPVAPAAASTAPPLFRDVSERLRHRHQESDFNDFQLQPLLPKRLSRLGPGVCWADLGGDGLDDLLIAAGRGAELGVFLNDGRGGFGLVSVVDVTGRLPDDQTTVLAWPSGPEVTTILVGTANYESGTTNDPAVRIFELRTNGVEVASPVAGAAASVGPLALADMDGDGELELFVGGRVIGGRYPEPASSRLFRRRAGQFELDVEATGALERVGLVSGAVFTDLNADGFPELALAGEWGPVKVFRNERGRFHDATEALGLTKFRGWWTSVTAGDFDGDGRADLLAGNWGRNTRYQRYLAHPIRAWHGEVDAAGLLHYVEGHFEPALGKDVPWHHWDMLGRVMPWVQERFASYKAFSVASVKEIVGERFDEMKEVSVTAFDSMLFLNRGDHFEPAPLPLEAQFAPVFGACAGDLDGDGHEDAVLAQNFFAVDPETARYDAGRGVWLKGDGRGQFRAVPGQESGLLVYGEGRGAALSDFDGDGRVDLAMAQNGAETKLYRNEGAKPGLRVRLKGPPGNALGAGAALGLIFGKKNGPAREVHLGAGYWSQDSATQVLATPEPPTRLWVRWPGGKTTMVDVPSGAAEVAVDTAGHMHRIR